MTPRSILGGANGYGKRGVWLPAGRLRRCAERVVHALPQSEPAAEVEAALRELHITCTAEDVRIRRLAGGEMPQNVFLGKHLRQVIPG